MPTPKCKEDFLFLLGLLGTLMLWIPNLYLTTDPIRSLIKRFTHWLCTLEHDQCLDIIKKKVNNLLVLSPFIPDRTNFIFMDASKTGVSYCLMHTCKDK